MTKGLTPKVKRSTLTRGMVSKANVKKHVKIQEKHDTWTKRLETIAKEKQELEKQKAKKPLAFFDELEAQLEQIEVKKEAKNIKKPIQNPHLKRVVSERGRKLALKQEKEQFLKVLSHPVFKANPLGAIETHLTNIMAQVTENAETKK